MKHFVSRFWAVVCAMGLFAFSAVEAGEVGVAVSLNTFGIVKVEMPTTNTMIAVPWTWYSKLQKDAGLIPAKKLVKTENLELGDMLYMPLTTNGVQDVYAAWTVVQRTTKVDGEDVTDVEWSPVQVVDVKELGFGRMGALMDDEAGDDYYQHASRIIRGNGMWLYRKKPLDDAGNIRPFWLYGQSVTSDVTTVVSGTNGVNATVCSTIIGNPYVKPVRLNDLDFQGTIASGDRIKLHNVGEVDRDLIYVSGSGWRDSTTTIVGGRKRTVYNFDTVIPAGTSFWYDRRSSEDLIIRWPSSLSIAR